MASSSSIRRTRTVIDGSFFHKRHLLCDKGESTSAGQCKGNSASTLRSNLGVSVVLTCTCWTLSSASDILHANGFRIITEPQGVALGGAVVHVARKRLSVSDRLYIAVELRPSARASAPACLSVGTTV